MIVYTVKVDIGRYQSAKMKDEEIWRNVNIPCRLVEKEWEAPIVSIIDSSLERGNFIHLRKDLIIMDQKACDGLEFLLQMTGELLPVNVEGEEGLFYIYNIAACESVLNYRASINMDAENKKTENWGVNPANKKPIYIDKYVFYENRLDEVFFILPEQPHGGIYFAEGGDEGDRCVYDRKRVYDENDLIEMEHELRFRLNYFGLKGLVLEEVWRSEN